jgi:hypothetical protein
LQRTTITSEGRFLLFGLQKSSMQSPRFAFLPCLSSKPIAEVKAPPNGTESALQADTETAAALLAAKALTLPDEDESFHFNKCDDELR